MNQQEMEDTSKVEKLSSAADFVEGGIQDACDDACSICLESFNESDPSTVTGCKHEYHLQCILEWCQRSSQCPMCWESICLKDPTSQELLEAVERERSLRQRQPRTTTIFRHPTLGDFELQHLPVDASEADLEERIIQHLAAAASMGRPHISRREGHRGRSRGHGRPQYLVFSAHPNSPPFGPSASSDQIAGENDHGSVTNAASPSVPVITLGGSPPLQVSSTQDVQIPTLSSSYGQNASVNQDRAGPSDLQSFSESLKSRFNAVSTRYKESIIKSTRGWREKLFSRNQSVPDVHSEVRRNEPGVETVSHGIVNLDMRENSRGASTSVGQRTEEHPPTLPTVPETHTEVVPDDTRGPSASSSTASELN